MKALVTGGAGFIGSNLVALLLAEGAEAIVYDNLSTGYRSNIPQAAGMTFVHGDVRDRAALEAAARGCEVVFHLAASVGNIRSIENPALDADVNVLGTLNVLETARTLSIPKVVFSSSAAIFGEVKRLPQNEDHPLDPDSPYGVSKLAAEKHCLCYTKLHGISAVCLRYFNVYGPNQRYDAYGNVIPIFATRLREGKPLTVYGDGEQTRDFVSVADVVRANILAAKALPVSGTFNIGSGVPTRINTLAATMQRIVGHGTSRIHYQPPRKGEILHSVADITKARAQLAYQPRVAVDVGLREYFAWLATL